MTEMSVGPLPEAQASAMRVFQSHCESTFKLVILICVMPLAAIAVIMAAAFNTEFAAQFVPIILVIWLLIVIYPFLLFGLFRSRTGLWWHFLNAHSGWVGISLVLTLLLVMMLDFVLPLIQGQAIYSAHIGYEPLILVILLPLFRAAFKSSTQRRADAERVLYADRWLKLAQLSVKDILFLRIPHERA